VGFIRKKINIRPKEVGKELDGPHFEFLTYPYFVARNFKFGVHIAHEKHSPLKCKIRSKAPGRGHVTHLWNFVPPYIENG